MNQLIDKLEVLYLQAMKEMHVKEILHYPIQGLIQSLNYIQAEEKVLLN